MLMIPQTVYTANDVYTVSDAATSVIAQVHFCTPFELTSSIHALLLPCYSCSLLHVPIHMQWPLMGLLKYQPSRRILIHAEFYISEGTPWDVTDVISFLDVMIKVQMHMHVSTHCIKCSVQINDQILPWICSGISSVIMCQ